MTRNANRGKLPSELGFLVDQLNDFEQRLRTLEAPDASQLANTVRTLQATVATVAEQQATLVTQQATLTDLVENLEARMEAFIADDVEAIIDAKVGPAIVAALAGNVAIGGDLTVDGTVTLPGARSTSLSAAPGRVTAWIAGDGRLGHTA